MTLANTKSILEFRARNFEKIRAFFKARNILEVETPLLYYTTSTAPHLDSFITGYLPSGEIHNASSQGKKLYLQTSPEFAMKRLLAARSGDIFQICKAFRNGERGRLHNHEFTILEWYRIGFDHQKLMDEMEDFLHAMLGAQKCERLTYAEAFIRHIKIDPHHVTASELRRCANDHGLNISDGSLANDKDFWLHLLMTHLIEPHLGNAQPTFVYDFPASQAMLAKVSKKQVGSKESVEVAERFEVYVKGIELANGFHELLNAKEQRRRFEDEIKIRSSTNIYCPPLDEKLLSALSDIPPCAGVALGLDRLLMLIAETRAISDVIALLE